MDNFYIDVTSEGRAMLGKVVEIAFTGSGWNRTAQGFRVTDDKGLLFLSAMSGKPDPKDAAFPFRMDAAGAADFAARWLDQAAYPREPDHDGDNKKGWRVYSSGLGNDFAICAVQPAWAMLGK